MKFGEINDAFFYAYNLPLKHIAFNVQLLKQ